MKSKYLYNNVDVVVVSCDTYSDAWPPFFENFFNNWRKCPLDIYLISNTKRFKHNKVKNINIGKDISWSDNLRKGLKKIKNKYVLLMIDDLLLNKKISNNYFKEVLQWINNKEPNYARLSISNKPKKYDNLFGLINSKDPYKISTMPSIWKKTTLEQLLKKGESAWDFEIIGSKRARPINNFFSVYNNLISYENAIIKGKWQKSVIYKFNIFHTERPIMSSLEQAIYNMKVLRSKFFNSLPIQIRILIKN